MMTYRVGFVSIVLGSLLWMACENEPQQFESLWSERDVVSERAFLPVDYQVEWSIGEDASDTLLLNPWRLSAGVEGVTVWDEGRQSVVRISPQGDHLWSLGRPGGGPGEFRSVRSIAHLQSGGLVAVDDANQRLTVIDGNGAMTREVNIEGWDPVSVAGLTRGGFVLHTRSPDHPFVLLDETGRVVDSLAFPWEPYRDLPIVASQGRILSVGSGWIFGFISGNGWWRFREDGSADAFPYAEHAGFPTVVTSTGTAVVEGRVGTTRTTRAVERVSTAKGFGARGDTLFVHFGGGSDDRRRVLDLFSLADGSYYGSVRLPRRADEAAVAPDAVYTLHANPFPVLTRLVRTSDGGDSLR